MLMEFYSLDGKMKGTQISSGVIYTGIPIIASSVTPVEEAVMGSVMLIIIEPIPYCIKKRCESIIQ